MGVWLRRYGSLLGVLGAACAAGCTVEERPARVAVPIMVSSAPPVERVEVQPVSPGARYVWVRGHWHFNGRDWLWIAGHWDAGRPGYQYMHGHWDRRGPRWVWIEGYWRRN